MKMKNQEAITKNQTISDISDISFSSANQENNIKSNIGKDDEQINISISDLEFTETKKQRSRNPLREIKIQS